jgi:hypothetical protein
MSPRRTDDRGEPRPEWLAAYADGALDDATRARVEAWLAEHPEAAADVENQRRLVRLFQAADPPAPSVADWDGLLARVEAGLRQAPPPAWPRRVAGALGVLAALAAAAALVAFLSPRPPAPKPDEPAARAEEPLPVVAADEVWIESMDDADRDALVVGEPPVRGPMALLERDEVQVNHLDADERGRRPSVHYTEEGPGNPMIVMPPAAAETAPR